MRAVGPGIPFTSMEAPLMFTTRTRRSFADRLTAYARDTEPDPAPDLVIPPDLTALDDEALAGLAEQAGAAFDALYGDGTGLSAADVEALTALTAGIEAINAEVAARAAAATERDEAAAALASRVRPQASEPDPDPTADPADPAADPAAAPDPTADPATSPDVAPPTADPEPVAVAASGRPEVRVNMAQIRSRTRTPRPTTPTTGAPTSMRDVVLAADVPGFEAGEGLDWNGLGRAVDRRLAGFNLSAYTAAHNAGRPMREQHGVAVLRRPTDPNLTITSNDPNHIDEVMRRAMDETRLPRQSLVASGGWCAPSETLYDLCELESNDGQFSLPEVNIARGGIKWTTGPRFSDIYAGTGFHYTEAQDEAGQYGTDAGGIGNDTAGTKPCYVVDCPDFTEARLEVDGVCITAGLLQSRGYPEVIARTVRGALVAHNHKMSARTVNAVIAGSTPVTYPTDTVGALAPLLTAIEQQAEHTRYINRMARATTLESTFPYWVRGVARTDLAQRLGLAEFDVSDARVDAWFRDRGISVQYIYDWQPLTGAAGSFVAWPSTVKFLLYPAGTWVKGTSDIITLDTIYDSVNLGTNDYTALFTEEGSLVAKMCEDSRVITVSLCPDGSTHAGVLIDCDGTASA